MSEDFIEAHKFASHNNKIVKKSKFCGCFYCFEIFPSEIAIIIRDYAGYTAWCPKCGIDSVLGDASGYPITVEFLKKMHAYWFSSIE